MHALDYVMVPWLGLAAIIIACAWLTVWTRLPTIKRHVSMALVPVGLLMGIMLLAQSVGWPSAIIPGLTAPAGKTSTVAGYKAVRDVAIFVLLEFGDGAPPRYYRMPWDEEMADALAQMDNDPNRRGNGRVTIGSIVDFFDSMGGSDDTTSEFWEQSMPQGGMPKGDESIAPNPPQAQEGGA